jgi:hypothetical protein
MPSHIFIRLGLWQESIGSNIASEAAARSHAAQSLPGAISQDGLHAMDYLVYAYLQTCQNRKAQAVVTRAAAATTVDFEVFQAAYAFAAIPARFALERRSWSEAAALRAHPAGFPWDRFRYAEAITHISTGGADPWPDKALSACPRASHTRPGKPFAPTQGAVLIAHQLAHENKPIRLPWSGLNCCAHNFRS